MLGVIEVDWLGEEVRTVYSGFSLLDTLWGKSRCPD